MITPLFSFLFSGSSQDQGQQQQHEEDDDADDDDDEEEPLSLQDAEDEAAAAGEAAVAPGSEVVSDTRSPASYFAAEIDSELILLPD